MAITRIKNSTIGNKTPKYNDVLAGLPFRPIIGTASDGGNGTSASVAFTGNNVANGTITYTALSSPGNFTGTGTASPITVSGLTAGTAYTFQVKAGNSLGDSAYSAASNSVTPVTPTAFESIATANLTGGTSASFTSIPSSYKHLQFRIFAKTAIDGGDVIMRFNNDSGNNYAFHYLRGDGSTVSASGAASDASIYISPTHGTYFLVGVVDIHDYSSTTKNKTARIFSGFDANGSGWSSLRSGLWMNTSAINRVDFTISGTTFSTGTTFALYGIRG